MGMPLKACLIHLPTVAHLARDALNCRCAFTLRECTPTQMKMHGI